MDDSADVVDEVNALLKLGVGDSYRLEHIKQAFVQNKIIWVTDENYLKRLREKYLVKQTSDIESDGEIVFENEPEEKETIHCWKCGKKGPLNANFCMTCGTSIFEIDAPSHLISKSNSSGLVKSIPLKIPILVGIPILILIIIGVGYTQGYLDNVLERSSSNVVPIPTVVVNDGVSSSNADSPCGPGTVFDSVTNSCVLGTASTSTSSNADSPCGLGTVFDSVTNSCVLDN